jgi:hypothetical protein
LGAVATHIALFADGVARVKHRLAQLIPASGLMKLFLPKDKLVKSGQDWAQ